MPDLAAAYIYRGLIYDEMGQAEKALADYREALRLDPTSEDARDYLKSMEQELEVAYQKSSTKQHLDQALAYALDDEPERALEECRLARDGMPEIATAYNYLGLILEGLEQVEFAIEAYLKAVQLNPRFYAARENLANARLNLEEEQYRQAPLQEWDGTDGEDSALDDEEETTGNFNEDQDTNTPDYGDPLPGWIYLDEKSYLLVGWPAHRFRPGRSGYDPLDTDFEQAHIEGVMIRMLFTGRFRTHNPAYLFMMACLCILFCLPFLFIWGSRFQDYLASIIALVCYSPIWISGIALVNKHIFELTCEEAE